jgi:hypothetical protein
MKYLKPDLFVRANSPDFDEALKASDEWELALTSYKRQLKSIHPKLLESARDFIDKINPHDCEVLGLTTPQLPAVAPDSPFALLFVRQAGGMVVLTYRLMQPPRVERCDLPESLRSGRPDWLYDEFDLVGPGGFSHEIFVSDGCLIKVVFSEMKVSRFDLDFPRPEMASEDGRSADLVAI